MRGVVYDVTIRYARTLQDASFHGHDHENKPYCQTSLGPLSDFPGADGPHVSARIGGGGYDCGRTWHTRYKLGQAEFHEGETSRDARAPARIVSGQSCDAE